MNNDKRSYYVEKILEALQFRAELTVDLARSLFLPKQEFRRNYIRFLERGPRQFKHDWAGMYRERRKFYNTLDYLRRNGFISKSSDEEKKNSWKITEGGTKRLSAIQDNKKDLYSLRHTYYSTPSGSGVIIVTFDIPEKERRARDWIRNALVSMEFRMLQKSVWISRGRKIDEDFIHALRERELLKHVHIFSISNRGTIQESLST